MSEYFPFIGLQWFADDAETQGRTEQPTEHKLQRLREEGQVPKSQELVAAIGLLLPAMTLLFLAPFMFRTCIEMVRFFFTRATELDPAKDAVIAGVFLQYMVKLALPILAVGFVSAIFSNVVQTGFLFTTKPLGPHFSNVLPQVGKFFSRIFSIDGFFNLAKSVVKMLIIGSIGFILIWSSRNKILNLQKAGLWAGLTTIARLAIQMLLICAVLMLAIAIVDFIFQRWRFRERNKMSRQEIKEEYKLYEADPRIQSRIRARFQELLKQNIAASVPRADVVITNPTHLAVALEYDRTTMPGPMVSALGADGMAARIRQIAEENGVPIVENKPLAWALFTETKVGDIIHSSHWNAVAVILARVWHLNEERRRKKSA